MLYKWFARVTPKCFISVSREFVSHDCFAKLFHKSVMQGSSKIQESFTRVSSKGVLQECFPKSYCRDTTLFRKSGSYKRDLQRVQESNGLHGIQVH